MKGRLTALAIAALATLASAMPISAFTPQSTAASQALAWLHTLQGTDGTVAGNASRTEETVWGLIANNLAVADLSTSGKTPIDSLRTHIADEEKSAGNIGTLLLAVSAAGLDPTTFAGRNLLQDLQCTYNPSTGAYNGQLFNDALAVLALPAGAATAKAKQFLASRQQADGGWEFQAGYGSDTNTSALVLMALVSADGLDATTRDKALAYFKLHQKPSGGFEYSAPFSPPGDSDPNSDAAVIEALLATGQDPTSAAWSIGDKNAVTDLLTFQYPNGGLGFTRPGPSASGTADAFSTTQALPALTSKYLPVKKTNGVMPSTCPAVPITTPTPTPSTTQLATTGAPPDPTPLLPMVAGLAIVALGWRLRRRAR
ncbi:MAG TPA: prenyltransferase/squalene oxidase repeat-containing protein [Candidatus Dormibacteraeota bacterium]|nr:prenyltransferase/squalene oxidase repeat-containing protein [Candidatus Dormibacteraeota bacterium]